MWEVVIVGGGPAGLAAALSLGRMRRNVLVIDANEPRNATSPEIHNVLTRDGTPPAEMRAISLRQLQRYPSVRLLDGTVAAAQRVDNGAFELKLAGGETVRAKRLLLATGIFDELPAIEGLAALWGTHALHCPYCHGNEVADMPLAALGHSEHRVRMAIHLTRLASDVVLCTNGEPSPADELIAKLQQLGVGFRPERIRAIESRGDDGIRIVFESGEPLERKAIFIESRIRQRSALAEQLGCNLLDPGIVEVDELGETTVRGVYAAGDMARRKSMMGPPAAVALAAATGTHIGAMIDQDLVTEDFSLSDPFRR